MSMDIARRATMEMMDAGRIAVGAAPPGASEIEVALRTWTAMEAVRMKQEESARQERMKAREVAQ